MSSPPITHVAIRFKGEIYSLPKPNRHHNVIHKIVEETEHKYVDAHGEDQGFLDANGKYLTRKEALVNALENKQIKEKNTIFLGRLYSEDIW